MVQNRRWLIAGAFFIVLILDFIVVRSAIRQSLSAVYPPLALVGVGLSIVVALALATQTTRALVLAAALLLFGWLGAFAAGSLYATCDLNMRPHIWQLIAAFGPVSLVITGAILAVPFLLWGAGSLVYKFIRRPSTALVTLLIVISIPCIAVGTYFVETAAGAHPTEGNCVI